MRLVQYDSSAWLSEEMQLEAPVYRSVANTPAELLKEIRRQAGIPQIGHVYFWNQDTWSRLAEAATLPAHSPLYVRMLETESLKIQYASVARPGDSISPDSPILLSWAKTIAQMEGVLRAQPGMPQQGPIYYKAPEYWQTLSADVELPEGSLLQVKMLKGRGCTMPGARHAPAVFCFVVISTVLCIIGFRICPVIHSFHKLGFVLAILSTRALIYLFARALGIEYHHLALAFCFGMVIRTLRDNGT